MNELIPIHNENPLLSEEEISVSKLSPSHHNKLFVLIIPFFLLLISKNKRSPLSPIGAFTRSGTLSNGIDENTLDKMSILLEGVKKATTINDLSKSLFPSDGSSRRLNMHKMKEIMDVLGSTLGDDYNRQIQNIMNAVSMMEKARDIKKIIDIQRSIKSENDGDMTAQMDNMVEMIRPMLSEEQAKNIDQFKQMAQMMKLMSMFEGDPNELEEEEEPTEG